MTEPLTGSCLCGGIRFELTERPKVAGYCHCTRCQRRTGSGSSAQARIDAANFRLLAGEELIGGWDPPDQGFEKCFCTRCGAHVFSRDDAENPTAMSIRMSAFDGDPGVRPSFRQFVDFAADWEPIPDDGLERFPGSASR
jgi:hypothetical protein